MCFHTVALLALRMCVEMPCGFLQVMTSTAASHESGRSHIFLVIEYVSSRDDDHTLPARSDGHFAEGTRNSLCFTMRFAIDRYLLASQNSPPAAGPIIWLPAQSASLRSQRTASHLLQLHPSSIICISTQMRLA